MPKCGAKAERLDIQFRFEDRELIQAAGKPFRKKPVVRATSKKVMLLRRNKRRTKR